MKGLYQNNNNNNNNNLYKSPLIEYPSMYIVQCTPTATLDILPLEMKPISSLSIITYIYYIRYTTILDILPKEGVPRWAIAMVLYIHIYTHTHTYIYIYIYIYIQYNVNIMYT